MVPLAQDNAAVQAELKKVLAKRVVDAMTQEVVSISASASMAEVRRSRAAWACRQCV